MGSSRAREIEVQLPNLKIENIETARGYDLTLAKRRIQSAGVSDLKMKQAINYRNNYMKEMEKYQNFENYDKLEAYLKKLSNPLSFYNKLESIDEKIVDLTYQSMQFYTQEEFNSFLNTLGIKTGDIQSSPEELQEIEMSSYEIKAKRLQERR